MDKKIKMNIQSFKNKKIVWFNLSESRSLKKRYKDSFLRMDNFFMKKKVSHTIEVDLSKNIDQIQENMDKGTKYEIRRCLKEGLLIEEITDRMIFVDFYNSFAKSKKLNQISNSHLNFSPNLVLRGIKNELDQLLAIHVYVINASNSIARLLYSATNAELYESNKALIGRANRLLHFNDICYFKEQGFKRYDLGGLAFQTTNRSLQGINKFKEGFGGEVREVFNYEPKLIYLLKYYYGKISSSS